MTAPRIDLDELERLDREATPIEAVIQTNSLGDDCAVIVNHVHKGAFDSRACVKCPACQKLAASWNALPALLAAVRAAVAWDHIYEVENTHYFDERGVKARLALHAALAPFRKEKADD